MMISNTENIISKTGRLLSTSDNEKLEDEIVDDEENNNNNNSDDNVISLRIQPSSGQNESKLVQVHRENCTVYELKHAILVQYDLPSTSYVRLIFSGRLLVPDTALITQFNIKQNYQVIHAVILQQQPQPPPQQSQRLYRLPGEHHDDDDTDSSYDGVLYDDDDGILDTNENNNNNNNTRNDNNQYTDLESGQQQRVTTRTNNNNNNNNNITTSSRVRRMPLGFDRLRVTAGLRRGEITAIRIYFSSHVDRWLQMNPTINTQPRFQQEPDVIRRRRLQEEAWMEAQGPTSEFRLNLMNNVTTTTNNTTNTTRQFRTSTNGNMIGTDRDFIWGFLLGFFVGFLMLIWVWMPTVPHKQKLGILTGYSFHLALGMLKGDNNKHGHNLDDGNGNNSSYDDVIIVGD